MRHRVSAYQQRTSTSSEIGRRIWNPSWRPASMPARSLADERHRPVRRLRYGRLLRSDAGGDRGHEGSTQCAAPPADLSESLQTCMPSIVPTRRRNSEGTKPTSTMCSCRRRSGSAHLPSGWSCQGDRIVKRRQGSGCSSQLVQRRRQGGSCSCRRRSGSADLPSGWSCKGDRIVG